MIDYRELLKKYMQHVLDEEGTTFIPRPGDFTKEEVAILQELDNSLDS